jgi:thioredoxin reductase (NADPH)
MLRCFSANLETKENKMAAKKCDLLILGGGIAGMTAAIYAARASLRVTLVESNICGGLVNSTHVVENVPSYKKINGMELMEKVREHVDSLGVCVEEVAEIEELSIEGSVKTIQTDETKYQARAVILAMGREPIPLDVAEGCEQVHYCSICDGAAYKGKKILVVGGGNSGFDESLTMLDMGVREILLIEKMDRFFAARTTREALEKRENASIRHSTSVEKLICSDRLTGAMLKNETTGATEVVDVDGIFVFMGQKPNTGGFNDLLELDEQGYILADENMHTTLPGVFCAGDVRKKKYQQITTAMSDGTIAALEAERYIRQK